MAARKRPNIGVYGDKTRTLQARLSYERVSLTWKTVNIYKYLGQDGIDNPSINDIEDHIFFETRNRAYDPEPIELNAHFEPMVEEQTDLSRFGIINPLADNLRVYMHTWSFGLLGLNRYPVSGDVIEVPFWKQNGIGSYWEVIEVDSKPQFETFAVVLTVEPVKDRQELEDITGIVGNSEIMSEIYSDTVDAMDTFVDEKTDTSGTDIIDDSESRVYNPTPNFIEDFITDNKILLPSTINSGEAFDEVLIINSQVVAPLQILSEEDVSIDGTVTNV